MCTHVSVQRHNLTTTHATATDDGSRAQQAPAVRCRCGGMRHRMSCPDADALESWQKRLGRGSSEFRLEHTVPLLLTLCIQCESRIPHHPMITAPAADRLRLIAAAPNTRPTILGLFHSEQAVTFADGWRVPARAAGPSSMVSLGVDW